MTDTHTTPRGCSTTPWWSASPNKAPDPLCAASHALLDGYQARHLGTNWIQIAVDDTYLLGNLTWHLIRTGRDTELVEVLSDPRWMHARITAYNLPI